MILMGVFSDLLYSSLLITYIGTEDEFEWKGYMYVGLLFSVSLIRTIMLQRYWHGCFVVGMRIRTAMTAAVYRKVRASMPLFLPAYPPPCFPACLPNVTEILARLLHCGNEDQNRNDCCSV